MPQNGVAGVVPAPGRHELLQARRVEGALTHRGDGAQRLAQQTSCRAGSCGLDRGCGLAREHAQQLHVVQGEEADAVLVEHLEHATGRIVHQGHGRDGAAHSRCGLRSRGRNGGLARPTGRWAGRWRRRSPRCPWKGAPRGPHAGALWARGDAELEPVGVALEQGDGGRLGVEQDGRRVDDGLEQRCLDIALQVLGDAPAARGSSQGGDDVLIAGRSGNQPSRRASRITPAGGWYGGSSRRPSWTPLGPVHSPLVRKPPWPSTSSSSSRVLVPKLSRPLGPPPMPARPLGPPPMPSAARSTHAVAFDVVVLAGLGAEALAALRNHRRYRRGPWVRHRCPRGPAHSCRGLRRRRPRGSWGRGPRDPWDRRRCPQGFCLLVRPCS